MRELLKTDLKRVLKDKLFLVLCIIAAAFALFMPLLFKLLFGMMQMEEMLGAVVDAKTLLFSAFMPGDNFGLICAVLLTIILCKDFSQGTIRNKIICGKKRSHIFLSLFITACIILCAVMLAHALLTLGISLCFFEYQATEFTAADFGTLMLSLLFELFVYAFVAALVSCLCVSMKNTGITVVLYVAVAFLCTILGSIVSAALAFSNPDDAFVHGLLTFLNNINLFVSPVIGSVASYGWEEVLYALLPSLCTAALLVGAGLLIFKKKDLK